MKLMNLSMTVHIIYDNSVITPVGQVQEHAMNDDMVQSLREMYEVLFCGCALIHTTLCQRFIRVKVGNKLYSSQLARTDRVLFVHTCLRMILDQLIPQVFAVQAVLITS